MTTFCLNNEISTEVMGDCDIEWRRFLNGEDIHVLNDDDDDDDDEINTMDDDLLNTDSTHTHEPYNTNKENPVDKTHRDVEIRDIITDINISTTTKITYLNKKFDLKCDFWKINVLDYYTPKEGVIKKQMKYIIENDEEQMYFDQMVGSQTIYTELMDLRKKNIIGTDKKTGKNVYKISIGIRSKDIINKKNKKSQAFFNCFVLIIRMKDETGVFTEVHMKIFNTGKIEIPGMKNDKTFYKVLDIFKNIYKEDIGEELVLKQNEAETILINSNFNCGFYINREKLYTLLKTKYNLNCSYDPCTYPGIQNVFYFEYNKDIDFNGIISSSNIDTNILKKKKHGNKNYVSFMVFRTGSILIVGKCNETILYKIYEFVKNLLISEYDTINCGLNGYIKPSKTVIEKIYRPIKYKSR